MAQSRAEWWERFFDDFYADFGLARTADETNDRIADYLFRHLELNEGDLVFDQCCGIARISVPLARRGIRVMGVDLSKPYIERARARALEHGTDCTFFDGDALEFVTPEPCDAAFNWFTSFGYHEDDSVNVKMLRCAYESLKPGGRFALEFQHMPRVMRDFQRWICERFEHDGGEVILVNESTPDFNRGMIDASWLFIHPDGRRDERRIATRMFMPHEIRRLMERVGFVDVRMVDWPDGEPLTFSSRRCVGLARRPMPP